MLEGSRPKCSRPYVCFNTWFSLIYMEMPETATVTSKSMVNIPARLRARYKIKPGSKIVFVEKGSEIILVPVPTLDALFGIDKDHSQALREGVRELNVERRREANEK